MKPYDLNKEGIDIIEKISNYRLYNSGKEELMGAFKEFRKNIKLLQYVYYFSKLESKEKSERSLEVIDDYIGFEWFKDISDDGTIVKDTKKKSFEQIFKKFRSQKNGLAAQEFVKAFLKLKSIKDEGFKSLERKDLEELNLPFTDLEIKNYYLLVTDGEMSFFSLLLILSYVSKYASEAGIKVIDWIENDNILTNSIICSESMGDVKSKTDKVPLSGVNNFVTEGNFINSMKALGLLSDNGSSARYKRMVRWLESTVVENKIHPSLRYSDINSPNKKNISVTILELLKNEDLKKDIRAFVKALYISLNKDNSEVLENIQVLNVRFNVGGEYLLRKNETIDRSFFAFPLTFISNSFMSNSQQNNIGSFAVGTLQDFKSDGSNEIRVLKSVLSELSRDIFNKKLYQVINNNIEESKNESLKSAKAAIMGRNMSHNIGSHVLYYLKGHLGSVTQMVRDNIVLNDIPYEIAKNGDDEILKIFGGGKPLNKIELPFLKGVGRFLTYLQERQDFIATIASSYHPSMVSVNFKDFIIDNFMADKRAERHGSELKREKNILLQYLTKSEGISVEIFLNGKSLSSKTNINDTLRNIEIDVPGGVLGRQAFYSILENIVRNAAKHGKSTDGETLILNVEIHSLDEKYYEVIITDNNTLSGKHAAYVDSMLDEELIDEQHKLIEHHKGLKEIKISALWLVGVSLNDIEKDKRKEFIRIENVDDQMAYRFRLFKSQKLAILTDQQELLAQRTNSKGYHFFDPKNILYELNTISKYNLVINSTSQKVNSYNNLFRRYFQFEGDLQFTTLLKSKPNSSRIYSTAYLAYLHRNFPYLNDHAPLICTDKLDPTGSNQELKVENEKLLNWIENDGISFIKSSDDNPIFYKPNQFGKKRIAFKRHFKEQNELKNFFGDSFNPDNYPGFNEKKKHVRNLIGEALKSYYSIESITGDNSTIRILYNEEKK